MKKEDVLILAQLLSSMRDLVSRLEIAERAKDNEAILATKREILKLQQEIGSRL